MECCEGGLTGTPQKLVAVRGGVGVSRAAGPAISGDESGERDQKRRVLSYLHILHTQEVTGSSPVAPTTQYLAPKTASARATGCPWSRPSANAPSGRASNSCPWCRHTARCCGRRQSGSPSAYGPDNP